MYKKTIFFLLLTCFMLLTNPYTRGAEDLLHPVIYGVRTKGASLIEIRGKLFGDSCQQCEVIAAYLDGFKYAFPVQSWSDKRIVVDIADISKGRIMKLAVPADRGSSNQFSFKIKSSVIVKNNVNKVISSAPIEGIEVVTKLHNITLGGKGSDRFNVSKKSPACGKSGYAFDHAEIIFKQKRFAEAEITKRPAAGCLKCSPLIVKWFNEPTGKLEYQLHTYQRKIEGICTNRKR